MPRPMTFDKTDALDKVLALFWDHGFEATSIRDMTKELGITATSLYNAFGDKRQLFLLALERYLEERQAARLAKLDAEVSPRRAIELLFRGAIEPCISEEDRRGCFLANAALERAPHDPQVRAVVLKGFEQTEGFLARKLAEAEAAGEIAGMDKPGELARGLLAAFLGLRSLVRAGAPETTLRDALKGALSVLDRHPGDNA
jgi:TetR/AcrR family transcriptional repressor of nem operon